MLNFKVTKTESDGNSAGFAIEPLEKGFGHTIGNCLRRVLLTSLEGAAITSIKIDGISHPFSTISGISEDVMQVILNLKQVRVKLFSEKSARMILKASGKGEVKASDIDTLGAGEIVNPDLYIASLNTPSAKLNVEIIVEKGVGYLGADEKKTSEIGVIPVDSIYTPVVSVDYSVEPTRVGRATDHDKLVLNVVTDGTVTPDEALNSAAKALSNYFKQIFEPVVADEEVVTSSVSDDVLKMSVEELDLPVRITNALKAVDIDTVEQLLTTPRNTLLKTKNLGVQSLTLISQKLQERGLTLSEA